MLFLHTELYFSNDLIVQYITYINIRDMMLTTGFSSTSPAPPTLRGSGAEDTSAPRRR